MVSRRNYFSILLIFAIVFFLFMGTITAEDYYNGYQENIYAKDPVFTSASVYTADDSMDSIAYIGEVTGSLFQTVSSYAVYTKRALHTYDHVLNYPFDESSDFIIVDGKEIDTEEEVLAMKAIAEAGKNIVFANLPDVSVLTALPSLQKLLGIQEIRGTAVLSGVHLFDGFLIGGEAIYEAVGEDDKELQDFDLEVPWLVTLEGTKTYMAGMMAENENDENQNEYLPALIFRNSLENSMIFSVYGDYLDSQSFGTGILSGFEYEAGDYILYPVVNAENLIVENFPHAANENDEMMQEIYGRNITSFESDIILPMLVAELEDTGFVMSAFGLAKYDSKDHAAIESGLFDAYLREFRQYNSEAGISFQYAEHDDIRESAEQSIAYISSECPGYTISSALIDQDQLADLNALTNLNGLEQIHTTVVANPDDSLFGYISDSITYQSETSDLATHTYKEDFKLRCLMTALAYSSPAIDMQKVLNPEESGDEWQDYSEKAFANLSTYWQPFNAFDHTTASVCDAKIRQFLALNMDVEKNEDTLTIHTENLYEEASYILRLHNQVIDHIGGGNYTEIEEGCYLITVKGEDCIVYLNEAANSKMDMED